MTYKSKSGIDQDGVMYDDMAGSLIGKRLYSTVGKVDYNYAGVNIKFQSGGSISNENDRIVMAVQYPHRASKNGKIYPHLHWQQDSDSAITFTLEYRMQTNGIERRQGWTTMTAVSGGENQDHATSPTSNVYTWNGGGYSALNQISRFNSNVDGHSGDFFIDMTDAGISATIQFRLARTDSISGDIYVDFFDYHYEIDSRGSRTEFVK